jgi:hypothetical protein
MRFSLGSFVGSAAFSAALVGISCASGPSSVVDQSGIDLMQAPRVYTLVNLHPDEVRARLYTVNYQQGGLIRRCSRVELVEIDGRSLYFRVSKTGKEYRYYYHKSALEPFDQHLLKYFGSSCDPDDVRSLSDTDQAGIRKGVASAGMTKQGVIYAIGYPPPHVTPDLDATDWTYWKNRFDRMIVGFDDEGRVVEVRD